MKKPEHQTTADMMIAVADQQIKTAEQNRPYDKDKDQYIIDSKHLRISYLSVTYVVIGLIAFAFIWYLFLNNWLGSTNVGSWLAKPNFTAQYWVYLQPENATSKNYKVKADISSTDGLISIDKAYWDNGGYITFDDCPLIKDGSKFASEGDCASNELINNGDDYQRYSVTLDQKVEP